jgi:hypothetical protein
MPNGSKGHFQTAARSTFARGTPGTQWNMLIIRCFEFDVNSYIKLTLI